MNSDEEKSYIPRYSYNNYSKVNFESSNGSNSNNGNNGYNDDKYDNVNNKQQQERYIWEMRKRSPNTTPASTVLNSPDLTDIHYAQHSLQFLHHHPHQIHVGRSPVSNQYDDNNHHHLPPQLSSTSPGSPTDVNKGTPIGLVREGEIVVFDDIDTNWKKSNNIENDYYTSSSLSSSSLTHQKLIQHNENMNNDDILKVTKMIGQLPIAEYEGSPRRIGNYQQQKQHDATVTTSSIVAEQNNSNHIGSIKNSNIGTVFPPRPGFPQRVSPSSNNISASSLIVGDNSDNKNETIANKQQNLIDANDGKNSINLNNSNFNNSSSNVDNGEDIDKPKTPTFDYLYEFSETRKVLEEFFKGPSDEDKKFSDLNESDDLGSCDTHRDFEYKEEIKKTEHAYIGQRLARFPNEEFLIHKSPRKQQICDESDQNDIDFFLDSASRSSGEQIDNQDGVNQNRLHSRNFTLSPETTDYDSNCGDLDSLSNDINCQTDFGRLYTSMPVLEDGLSSGHASDTENNLSSTTINASYEKKCIDTTPEDNKNNSMIIDTNRNITETNNKNANMDSFENKNLKEHNFETNYSMNVLQHTPPPPAPAPHRLPPPPQSQQPPNDIEKSQDIQEALKDIKSVLQRTKTLPHEKFTKAPCDEVIQGGKESPIWVPRRSLSHESSTVTTEKQLQNQSQAEQKSQTVQDQCNEDEEADTDLETDRLLGQQRLDDKGFYDDKNWSEKNSKIKSPLNTSAAAFLSNISVVGSGGGGESRGSNNSITSDSVIGVCTTSATAITTSLTTSPNSIIATTTNRPQTFSSATIRQGIGTSLTPISPDHCQIICSGDASLTSPEKLQFTKSPTGSMKSKKDSSSNGGGSNNGDKKLKARNKEALLDPAVLIEGVLFRARYLGSTQLVCEGQPTKSTRMMQAEEAVSRIKAPEGETQPSTEVDLFISTEKIMVLNTDLKEIMMDHALRTISYIADIGDLVVLMARRRFVPSDNEEGVKPNRTPKMICHVFESDEAQFIAQSIGQAFQVAYMEFLKANGIEDHSFVKEMDYQEVLNSQEIFGDELEIFAKKELQKEVVVPKAKGEILGVVIVESGWGSMLPTVVIANLMSSGAAARCGQLNIGDQLIAINGMSLVGLPLSTCQSYIRNTKNQTAVKFTVVPCPPVVEVKIKRPNTKYQLGFSVQNGVICSLLRGGIAERGGVRVGHRIIEINNQSVVAVPHEKIVNLLATSVGEILMKTMPTSMFRLLTGQENPIYI